MVKTYKVNSKKELQVLADKLESSIFDMEVKFPNRFFNDPVDGLVTVEEYLDWYPDYAYMFEKDMDEDKISETENLYHNDKGIYKIQSVDGSVYSANRIEDIDHIFRYNNITSSECDCNQEKELNISKCFVGCKHLQADEDGFVCNKHCKWIRPLNDKGNWIGAGRVTL